MAESPVKKLARLVGGVAMLPGPLGHQALGQLLISGSKAVEVAGANVTLAAAFRQTNAVVRIAVGSIVPAAVVEALSRKEQRRIAQERRQLERLSNEIAQHPHAADQISLRLMVPSVVAEALIRNHHQRIEEERHQQWDLKVLSDKVRGLRLGAIKLRRKLKRQSDRFDYDMKDLRRRFEEYAPERFEGALDLHRDTKPPDAAPVMTPAAGPEESTPRGERAAEETIAPLVRELAADTSSKLAARKSKSSKTTTAKNRKSSSSGRQGGSR